MADDFVPQAILRMTEREATQKFELIEGIDDFDHFIGAAFVLDDGDLFAIRRYAGHPLDTFTVYLPYCCESVEQITSRVFRIVDELTLPRQAVIWERSQDPDL